MYLLFLLHRHYEINTVMVAIFVFDTRVTEQTSGMIKNAGKHVKRKGVGSAKYSKTKMEFRTEMRGLIYIYKRKSLTDALELFILIFYACLPNASHIFLVGCAENIPI